MKSTIMLLIYLGIPLWLFILAHIFPVNPEPTWWQARATADALHDLSTYE